MPSPEVIVVSCANCRFAILEDNGYSNYTVEGTEFRCAKRMHPDGQFDRFYGVNPKFEHAKTCDGYEYGLPFEIDVEKENLDNLTEADKELIQLDKMHALLS